jgi:hypothetical protein
MHDSGTLRVCTLTSCDDVGSLLAAEATQLQSLSPPNSQLPNSQQSERSSALRCMQCMVQTPKPLNQAVGGSHQLRSRQLSNSLTPESQVSQ